MTRRSNPIARPAAIAALALVASCKGPTGPMGANGTDGTNGTSGVSGYTLVDSSGTYDTRVVIVAQPFTVHCASGAKAIGGGYAISPTTSGYVFAAQTSAPLSDGSGWQVTVITNVNSTATVTITAICATVS